jgi:hypothetical protein
MLVNKSLCVLAVLLTTLALSPEVHAWGAAHAGYTSVGPGGVQHYGATAASGPYGSRTGTSSVSSSGGTTSYSANGTVNSGLWAGQGYHYSGTTSTGTAAAGFPAAPAAYGAGVYRGW